MTELSLFPEQVRPRVAEIEEARNTKTDDIVLQLCRALLADTDAVRDDLTAGYALFTMGRIHFVRSDSRHTVGFLTGALERLVHTEGWVLLSRCYNLLGITLNYQGNYIGSAEYFFEGLHLADEHALCDEQAILHHNLREVYELAGDYQAAVDCARTSLACIGSEDCSLPGESELTVRSALLRLDLETDDLDDAGRQMEQLRALTADLPAEKMERSLEIFVYAMVYAGRTGDPAGCAALMKKATHAVEVCVEPAAYFIDVLYFIRYLRTLGRLEQAAAMAELMEKKLGEDAYADQMRQLLDVRIALCAELGRQELLPGLYKRYYEAAKRRDQSVFGARRATLRLKRVSEQIRHEKRDWQRRAETDDLTGLPNRRKLNEVQDAWFERAYAARECLAVEMLDIDNFKQLNDGCGHAAGDRYLTALGEVLRSCSGPDQFCARYGGDEFVVLYYGLTEAEVRRRALLLRERVAEAGRTIGADYFSVSQGIRIGVPFAENRIWDYTASADRALYRVKKTRRGAILMVHTIHEVETNPLL